MNGYTAGGTVLQYLINSYMISTTSRRDDERQLIATALLGGGATDRKKAKKRHLTEGMTEEILTDLTILL